MEMKMSDLRFWLILTSRVSEILTIISHKHTHTHEMRRKWIEKRLKDFLVCWIKYMKQNKNKKQKSASSTTVETLLKMLTVAHICAHPPEWRIIMGGRHFQFYIYYINKTRLSNFAMQFQWMWTMKYTEMRQRANKTEQWIDDAQKCARIYSFSLFHILLFNQNHIVNWIL